jgi:hypothetical protein
VRVIYKSRLSVIPGGCGSPPRSPTSDLGRYSSFLVGEADAGRDSMRLSRCCIEMPTGTGNFSAPATMKEAGR